MNDTSETHWETVYATKQPTLVSWYRPHLDVSIALLQGAGVNAHSRVIDIGAGASTLVDDLLDLGVEKLSAMDISSASLAISQRRLGERAQRIDWIVGDIVRHSFQPDAFDIWHDRAVLHFLTVPADVTAYVRSATAAVTVGGYLVIGGFASDGPEKCSGLSVIRRDPSDIATLFHADFSLVNSHKEQHATPSGGAQSFAYALLRKNDGRHK